MRPRRPRIPSWPRPLEIRYRPENPRDRMIKATGVFLLALLFAFIPTVASFKFFQMVGFTDLSALALAGGVGVLVGMITAAVFA